MRWDDEDGDFPRRIGRYHVLGRIGSGGMGEVFLAWDPQLKRRVAIKRIRKDIGLSPEQQKRFNDEACQAARLNHQNVVQVYDVIFEGDAILAIVMEHIEGRTLAERLAAERLEIPYLLRLALEIARGLAEAHEAGLVHRDLKAANVLVTRSGHAKIVDFGLARPVARAPGDQDLTQPGRVMGTSYAMSPEQIRGEEVDRRSDLFSFGSLFHEMLTGRPPFRGKDALESQQNVLSKPPVPPRTARPDLPIEAAALLLRLLKKDRDDRPGSIQEVIAILEPLQTVPAAPQPAEPERRVSDLSTTEETIPERPEPPRRAPSPPPPPEKPPFWTRRRVLAGAAMLLLATMAVAAALTAWSWRLRPLRVAVIDPEYPSGDKDLALAASTAQTAVLQALGSFEKLTPIAPSEMTPVDGEPVQIAQAVFAAQVFTISLEREGGTALVTLQRINVADGEVRFRSQLSVPLGRDNRPTLAAAVAGQVQEGYSDFSRRPGIDGLEVEEEDYHAWLDIQERLNAGEVRREDLIRLESMLGTSPRFAEAPMSAARIAHSLFQSRRELADLELAAKLARRAHTLDRQDPRPLRLELDIALTGNRIEVAEDRLENLEQLLPGNPDILPLQAELAEKQGRKKDAEDLFREAVEQIPSWQNRFRLADFEARHGRIEEARARIDGILRQAPGNLWALRKLGEIELFYGDLARAERIYQGLVSTVPERALCSLGTVRYLRGNLAGAADSYRRALAIAPDYLPALISLAEVELELGRKREAEEIYRRALARLETMEAEAGLTPYFGLWKARCLVRLGRTREAVEIAQTLGPKAADHPAWLHQMALIYSLAGERTLAIEHARAALARGLQPHWFAGSAFRWLRESPELRPYLQTAASP